MLKKSLIVLAITCGAALIGALAQPAQAQTLKSIRLVAGLTRPVFVNAPPGDATRLFVVEQSGRIKIINLATNTVLPTPFLDVSTLIAGGTSGGDERGLLGMTFHPNYASNGYFYIYYYSTSASTLLRRYQVSADPNIANPASAFTLMTIAQPYTNHNGGWLGFGPDGYLYISLGDGGSGNDPQGNGQNLNTRLGKLLRIDVDGGSPYAIPPSNPFAAGGGLPEIWAYGLRNPWRCSFDRLTGDLFIGDVGQNAREELDFQLANAPGSMPGQPGYQGGRNYGWRCMEGLNCTGLSGCVCNAANLVLPFYQYTISGSTGCSVTGGYVYRGSAIPWFRGTYIYGDWCSPHQIWSCKYDGVAMTEFVNRTAELAPGGGFSITSISSFGEDANGELYICDLYGGEIFKIIPGPPINDNCINATLVSGSSSTTFSTGGATTDGPDETACGFTGNTQIGADVWYRFVATCTGNATVSVCGADFDTRLAAYVGCPAGPGATLACNDNACGAASQITFAVTSGVVYRIRLGGANSATGSGTLVITCTVPPQCPADINGDGTVNVSDLLAVINTWGPCPGCPSDINGDGTVNVSDLLAVINAWGPCR